MEIEVRILRGGLKNGVEQIILGVRGQKISLRILQLLISV